MNTLRPNECNGVPWILEPRRHTDLLNNAGHLKYIPRPSGVHALNETLLFSNGVIAIQPIDSLNQTILKSF